MLVRPSRKPKTKSRSYAAIKQLKYRQRLRAGRVVRHIEVGPTVFEALRRKAIADGATPVEAEKAIADGGSVGAALSQLCEEWACQYLGK